MRRFTVLVAIALTLGACQSVPKDYVQFHAGQEPSAISKHMAERVGTCWFDGKHKAFEHYSYAPEPSLASTRILIVPKDGPHGLPALIIEVLSAKRGTDVRLFGPLMQSGDANTIRNDVMRWTGGARDC